MKTLPTVGRRRSMQGLSLVELMIAMTLGLIVLAALVSVFANTSASRAELERTARQIENGRFAMELLADDLRHAGFYGETNVKAVPVISAPLPDPCEALDFGVWRNAMPVAVQAYDNGAGLPPCFAGALKPNTDVVVVRRVATCEAGVGDCPLAVPNKHYIQVASCANETAVAPFVFGLYGVTPTACAKAGDCFNLTRRDCTTPAHFRRYFVRFYYIATNNGQGQSIPTLTRMELDTAGGFTTTPLVEGIEELNLEYGVDTDDDGAPDVYTANPTTLACGTACASPTEAWSNVVSARIHLLARSVEGSPNYRDTKEYVLGHDAGGFEVRVQPNDQYRRHAYQALVRIVNAAERRDRP